MRHAPPILAAMMLALAPAAPAPAAAAAVAPGPTLVVPAAVTAGQVVTLRWSGLPADVAEVEIVLSLDGGRSYHVRVSPELEAREGGYRWRVPDLPAIRARLLLRTGGGAGERAGAVSGEFRIVHASGVEGPQLGFHEGQFWTGFDDPPAVPGLRTGAAGPRFEDVADPAPCAPVQPAPRVVPAADPYPGHAGATSVPVPLIPARASTPRQVPLRS